jgi:hypothetical protein
VETVYTGDRRSQAMGGWIDKRLEQTGVERERQRTLRAMGLRYWEALRETLSRDAAKLNARALSLLRSEIQVSLTVKLDLDAETIKISQTRKETLESPYRDTSERLELRLVNGNGIVCIAPDGSRLDLEGASEYILGRFLQN